MENNIKILYVEDNESDLEILKHKITKSKDWKFSIFNVSKIADVDAAVKDLNVDIVLLDLKLLDSDQDNTLLFARKLSRVKPVIIMTSTDDKLLIDKIFESGAQDYLVKGEFDTQVLTRSIIYSIERGKLFSELKRYQSSLEELVTQRTQQLTELNRQLILEKHKFQKYLDIVGVIVVILDIDGNVVLINKKGAEILGFDEIDVVSKNWFSEFVPPEDLVKTREVFQKLVERQIKSSEYHENEILTKSGERRLIAWHNTVFMDEAGKVISVLGSGNDITEIAMERKKIERYLRDLEQFKKMTIGREHMMIKLKQEVNALSVENGRPPVYDLSFLQE